MTTLSHLSPIRVSVQGPASGRTLAGLWRRDRQCLKTAFSDPQPVARDAENPSRLVPGDADLQRMALVLLAEPAPIGAQMLILGTSGGLESKIFAEARPGGAFVGVDPSPEMLGWAQQTLGRLQARVASHGWVADAREFVVECLFAENKDDFLHVFRRHSGTSSIHPQTLSLTGDTHPSPTFGWSI